MKLIFSNFPTEKNHFSLWENCEKDDFLLHVACVSGAIFSYFLRKLDIFFEKFQKNAKNEKNPFFSPIASLPPLILDFEEKRFLKIFQTSFI